MEKENFIVSFFLILLFLIFLIDPSNKILLGIFFLVVLILAIKGINLSKILISIFVITLYLPNGKTYVYQLLDIGKLYPHLKDLYPLGLFEEIKITINDIFSILILFHLIRDIFIKKINLIKFINKTLLFFILIVLSIIISNFINSPNISLSLYLNKNYLKIFLFYLYIRINQNNISKNFILYLILIITFFQSYLALIQFLNGSPLGKEIESIHNIEVFGKVVDEISFYYRPTGTYEHANFLGGFLSFGISLILYKILFLKEKNFFILTTLIISIISLSLTLSRSGFYSLIIFLFFLSTRYKNLIYFYLKKIKKIIFIIIIIFFPLLIIPFYRFLNLIDAFSPSGGFYLRANQFKETLELISVKFLFGTGTGFSVIEAIKFNPNGVFASFPSYVHNFYLLLLIENGIFSFIFFITFLFLISKEFLSKNRVFFYILISLIFFSLFQSGFFINEIFFLYAIINKNEQTETADKKNKNN